MYTLCTAGIWTNERGRWRDTMGGDVMGDGMVSGSVTGAVCGADV